MTTKTRTADGPGPHRIRISPYDNQYGRTQKLVPKLEVDPYLLIRPPWRAR